MTIKHDVTGALSESDFHSCRLYLALIVHCFVAGRHRLRVRLSHSSCTSHVRPSTADVIVISPSPTVYNRPLSLSDPPPSPIIAKHETSDTISTHVNLAEAMQAVGVSFRCGAAANRARMIGLLGANL